MRITITSEGKTIKLVFPTFLILNRAGLALFERGIASRGLELRFLRSGRTRDIIRAIKSARRELADWYIVDIESADGETIKIKL